MSSPKFIFYLSQSNNVLKFNKTLLCDSNNKFKYSEIHISQFIVHSKYKQKIIEFSNDYCSSITVSIDNFNENVDMENNYTIKILDIQHPYIYNNSYSSKSTQEVISIYGNEVHLKLDVFIDNETSNNFFYLDEDPDSKEATIFEIELFFK